MNTLARATKLSTVFMHLQWIALGLFKKLENKCQTILVDSWLNLLHHEIDLFLAHSLPHSLAAPSRISPPNPSNLGSHRSEQGPCNWIMNCKLNWVYLIAKRCLPATVYYYLHRTICILTQTLLTVAMVLKSAKVKDSPASQSLPSRILFKMS